MFCLLRSEVMKFFWKKVYILVFVLPVLGVGGVNANNEKLSDELPANVNYLKYLESLGLDQRAAAMPQDDDDGYFYNGVSLTIVNEDVNPMLWSLWVNIPQNIHWRDAYWDSALPSQSQSQKYDYMLELESLNIKRFLSANLEAKSAFYASLWDVSSETAHS